MLNPLEVFNVLDPLSARDLLKQKVCFKIFQNDIKVYVKCYIKVYVKMFQKHFCLRGVGCLARQLPQRTKTFIWVLLQRRQRLWRGALYLSVSASYWEEWARSRLAS